ncbi:MAG: hypothetical protein Q7S61_06490 [bacterium]|nr:hypothetical protein [bacterium]
MADESGKTLDQQPEPLSEYYDEMARKVEQLLKSKFGFIKEQVEIKKSLLGTTPIYPLEAEDDVMFRSEVARIINTEVLSPTGKTLILLDLATQHAIATLQMFYLNGVDCYSTLFPRKEQIYLKINHITMEKWYKESWKLR